MLWDFMHFYASIINSLKTCNCICKYSIAFNPPSSDDVFQRLSEKYIRYDKKKVIGAYFPNIFLKMPVKCKQRGVYLVWLTK